MRSPLAPGGAGRARAGLWLQRARRGRRGPGLTPLIDVVFLLLIFFMLASRLGGERALELALRPVGEARAASAVAPDVEPLEVALLADGGARLQAQPVPAGALRAALARACRERRPREAIVRCQDAVPVQRVTRVLEWLAELGVPAAALGRER